MDYRRFSPAPFAPAGSPALFCNEVNLQLAAPNLQSTVAQGRFPGLSLQLDRSPPVCASTDGENRLRYLCKRQPTSSVVHPAGLPDVALRLAVSSLAG